MSLFHKEIKSLKQILTDNRLLKYKIHKEIKLSQKTMNTYAKNNIIKAKICNPKKLFSNKFEEKQRGIYKSYCIWPGLVVSSAYFYFYYR